MKLHRPAVAALMAVIAVGCWVVVGAGQQVPLPTHNPLPLEPLGNVNEAIFPALEGWGPHKDGANVILLGYFLIQLVATIANTLAGVLISIQAGAIITLLGFILYGLLSIYLLSIIIRIIFSWGMVSYTNRVMKFLVDVTEPLLGPLRRMIPPLGWLDISPLVAIVIIWLFQAAVAGTLLRGAPAAFQAF